MNPMERIVSIHAVVTVQYHLLSTLLSSAQIWLGNGKIFSWLNLFPFVIGTTKSNIFFFRTFECVFFYFCLFVVFCIIFLEIFNHRRTRNKSNQDAKQFCCWSSASTENRSVTNDSASHYQELSVSKGDNTYKTLTLNVAQGDNTYQTLN